MRLCVIYDCLYPQTVGGAERWYRDLALRLAAAGHEVTYLTLRQWHRGEAPVIPGVRIVAAGPRMSAYTGVRRRIVPPLVFGLGVFWHLARFGRRYDVVHTGSFPYFSLLAAGALRPLFRYRLVVDWFEVWSRGYWREYLGGVRGWVGYSVQLLCAWLPQQAFCFSRLHAARLHSEGLRGELVILEGMYAGSLETPVVGEADASVVFAGRMIPEKRAPLAVAAVAAAAERIDGLRATFFGDGPERPAVQRAIDEHSLAGRVTAPGFVAGEAIDLALEHAMCMLAPSRREGYGMVVIEAAARGTPSIVVAGEDNAATELVEDGVNGILVETPDAEAIADAIVRVSEAGRSLRESTARWFETHAQRLSLESSLRTVLAAYAHDARSSDPASQTSLGGYDRAAR